MCMPACICMNVYMLDSLQSTHPYSNAFGFCWCEKNDTKRYKFTTFSCWKCVVYSDVLVYFVCFVLFCICLFNTTTIEKMLEKVYFFSATHERLSCCQICKMEKQKKNPKLCLLPGWIWCFPSCNVPFILGFSSSVPITSSQTWIWKKMVLFWLQTRWCSYEVY